MAHFDFAFPSAQVAPEMVPGASHYQRWDSRQARSLNGDLGGIWANKAPIVIGGAGLQVTGACSMFGGVQTKLGGRLLTHGYPTVNSRKRTLFVPVLECGLRVDVAAAGGSDREDRHVIPHLTGLVAGVSVDVPASLEIPKRYVHTGARWAFAAVNFVIASQPASLSGLPTILPVAFSDAGAQNTFSTIPAWIASHTYAAGAYANGTNGFYFRCTVGGTGSSFAPTWPSVIGATVTDGTITWTNVGRNGAFQSVPQLSTAAYYANGSVQTLEFDTDSGGSANVVIDVTANRYAVQIGNADPNMIITGLTLRFDGITSLQPE